MKTTADEGSQVELARDEDCVRCGCATVGALTLFSRPHSNLMLYRSTPDGGAALPSHLVRACSFFTGSER